MDYNALITDKALALIKSFHKIYLVETFEFSQKIKIKRKRPLEFYSQLKKANQLIRSVSSFSDNILTIDVNREMPYSESNISYDAVHFTVEGHKLMYNICKNAIDSI